jgi:putative transcriptional regulator
MRERTTTTRRRSLAGSLLVARPELIEGTFRHTVILMSNHTREGAMGVVLNRPLNRTLGEMDGEFALGPLAGVPVFQGGPVQTDQMILAAWRLQDGGFQLHFGLDPARATALATEEGMVLRAFLGYSGWSGGQLEGELRRTTWVTTPIPPDLMRHDHDESLWRAVLRTVSWEWKVMAEGPDDPSRN